MAVSSRERTSQRSTWPVQSPALETHWRASVVLSIASSAAGTNRTRSCSPSPTALPSPRQAGSSLFLLLHIALRAEFNPKCYSRFPYLTRTASGAPPPLSGLYGTSLNTEIAAFLLFSRRNAFPYSSGRFRAWPRPPPYLGNTESRRISLNTEKGSRLFFYLRLLKRRVESTKAPPVELSSGRANEGMAVMDDCRFTSFTFFRSINAHHC
jgi:hypothetical protein